MELILIMAWTCTDRVSYQECCVVRKKSYEKVKKSIPNIEIYINLGEECLSKATIEVMKTTKQELYMYDTLLHINYRNGILYSKLLEVYNDNSLNLKNELNLVGHYLTSFQY